MNRPAGDGSSAAGRPARRRIAHTVALLAVALAVLGGVLAVLNRHTQTPNGDSATGSPTWGQFLLTLAFAAAGWLLASRRPDVIFGWLALAAAIGHGLAVAGFGWLVYTVGGGHQLPGAMAAAVAALWGEPLENPVLVVVWATFPHGRLPRGRTRWLALASIALCAGGWLYGLLSPFYADDITAPYRHLHNPLDFGLLPRWQPVLLFAGGMLLGSVVMVVRWRRARGEERQVLRWLAVTNVAGILVTPFVVALPAGELIATVGTLIDLVVVAAVVLAHQVYGIDVVLNRTLVYTLLTAFVAGVYAAGVGVLALLGASVGGPWTAVAALAAAFALAPARGRVQRIVNRFLYGERDEPYTVIGRIASRLEAAGSIQQLLPSLLESVAAALQLPWTAVEMRIEDGTIRRIAHGTPAPDGAGARFPLVHQGVAIGELVAGLRAGQSSLAPREARLMEDIARQIAVAASNVLLTEALMLSRERIVAAAEEERRRLRRDLHDGLGPVLTAAANKVDAARNLAGRDLPRARGLLGDVRGDLTAALADLRRLVYALRPPILDELGLLAALREQVRQCSVPVTLAAPTALPALPAAVEIAAYRIVTEAVTNVTRHSGASRCTVTIACDGLLAIEIRDDGAGGALWPPGIGLSSMRERATALGGSWLAGPTPDGGRVAVELPLALAGSPAPHDPSENGPGPALTRSTP
ncbi:sensor histidine kinase [Streptomyces sp. NBC_01236]|uniref:sensor histidine kinase n=1 Tax=Streptomyces sp. NBC_01236 TaxID=2903789 RepID=UPI002E108DD9|nr:sensor histidine kinase [Streptomyces sp. NBC_01236]